MHRLRNIFDLRNRSIILYLKQLGNSCLIVLIFIMFALISFANIVQYLISYLRECAQLVRIFSKLISNTKLKINSKKAKKNVNQMIPVKKCSQDYKCGFKTSRKKCIYNQDCSVNLLENRL